jgi:PAS domain S-box-containing protein
MGDHYKSKEQLIIELELARKRIAELENASEKSSQKYRESLLEQLELAHRRIEELEKITEKTLQKYDDYFRIHFSLSNDVMYSYDNKYTLHYITPNVERILGYKPEELIGRKISDLLSIMDPLDHDEVIEDAFHALSGNTIMYSIYRFIAKDGSMKFSEVSGVPIIRDGKVVAVISVAREITERAATTKSQDKTMSDQIRIKQRSQVPQDSFGVVLDLNNGTTKILGK